MTTQTETITIPAIETKPRHDPYINISGIVSRTYLKLDPRDRTIWVDQEYNDNASPADEWHGLVLTWAVPGHPTEDAMREWIDSHMNDFAAICAGYEDVWNGNNRVGELTDDARAIMNSIEFELDNDAGPRDHYVYWTLEEWVDIDAAGNVNADTTDEALRQMASDAISALESGQLLDTDEDGVYEYLKAYRDEKRDEMQDEE